jgi:predicted Zn-dependent peptidase
VGGRLTASADDDGTQVTCRVLSKDVGACLELVPDVVLNPAFPEAELGQVRDQLLASVKQVRDMPQLLAREHLANLLWGEAHVRGWPMTAASVQAITRQHLVDWHAAAFKPNGSILFAAGDFEPVALRAALEKAFGVWPQGPLPPPRVYFELCF